MGSWVSLRRAALACCTTAGRRLLPQRGREVLTGYRLTRPLSSGEPAERRTMSNRTDLPHSRAL